MEVDSAMAVLYSKIEDNAVHEILSYTEVNIIEDTSPYIRMMGGGGSFGATR